MPAMPGAIAASSGQAQQCSLNRKSLTFDITVCSEKGCVRGAERVDVVGANIIHYSNAGAAEHGKPLQLVRAARHRPLGRQSRE